MNTEWLFLLAGLATYILTGLLKRYSLAKSLLDIPNERSSHTVPTPRGGGLAIVVVFLFSIQPLYQAGMVSHSLLWALIGSGSIVAVTGFWDDHRHIAARWRLLLHFGAATWGLYWLGGLPPVILWSSAAELGWVGHVLALFYLVWLLNLYNFMDGIDGIASIEAITVCIGGVLLVLLDSNIDGQWRTYLLLAVVVIGFLAWNFPPAKIFMGDAGSGFLGMELGLFSIQAAWTNPKFFWSWLILLGVFIVDATLTLIRRYLRGEKVYQAHRSHAYQNASRLYKSHKPVSLAVGGINLLWLMPIALWVGLGNLDGLWGAMLAYFPLLLLALHFKAGVKVTES